MNKPKDPCEKDLECKQDKEKINTGEQKTPGELNWTHKNKIAEAEGINIDPNRKWSPGYIPDDAKPETKEEEKKTQEPKYIYTGKEKPKEPETQSQQTTGSKEKEYNPEEALIKSIQERATNLPQVKRIRKTTKKDNEQNWKREIRQKIRTLAQEVEKDKAQKVVPSPNNIESQDRKTETKQVNIQTREPQKIRKTEEKETIDTYQYQEEMRILTDPTPKNNNIEEGEVDDFLFYYRQMEDEANIEIEQIRKLSRPQTAQDSNITQNPQSNIYC